MLFSPGETPEVPTHVVSSLVASDSHVTVLSALVKREMKCERKLLVTSNLSDCYTSSSRVSNSQSSSHHRMPSRESGQRSTHPHRSRHSTLESPPTFSAILTWTNLPRVLADAPFAASTEAALRDVMPYAFSHPHEPPVSSFSIGTSLAHL